MKSVTEGLKQSDKMLLELEEKRMKFEEQQRGQFLLQMIQNLIVHDRLYTIGGLDWRTGLVDWTTGLIDFHFKHAGMIHNVAKSTTITSLLVCTVFVYKLGSRSGSQMHYTRYTCMHRLVHYIIIIRVKNQSGLFHKININLSSPPPPPKS